MFYRTLEVTIKDEKKVALRSVRPEEAEKVLNCLKKFSGQTRFLTRTPEEITMTVDDERKYLENRLDEKGAVQIGAYLDDQLVGLGSIWGVGGTSRNAHRCEVGISLDEEYWNLGIGSRMMESLIDVAQRVGYEQMELHVLSDNEQAIHLYEKYGFEKCGTVPNAYKDSDGMQHDEDTMIKNLTVKFEPWEKATMDLEEWIEEQGIQLRY
ncbi:Ribosomal protein S18 acetylase RimI [Lachnospiraceae bacterium XBB1006]|nr:Ribosomal protein S18 acetylase RimI [Lachnospiraceae bacterium XBB1006]